MITPIRMPPLSETMEEGRILRWLQDEGTGVAAGDVLCEIETDKANVIIEAPVGGILRRILLPAAETAPVGAIIAIITDPDDGIEPFPR